jgi:CDP-diacylglycerol---glycerol-3-phosphate 3-phosphatidyltransferase
LEFGNIPNKITLASILFIPVFIFFVTTNAKYPAAITFFLLAASDAIDGHIARINRQVTKLGTLIDPLADKLLISAALIFLIGKGIDAWMVFVIIAREFAVTGLRMLALTKDYTMSAKKSGKVKMIFQVVAVLAVILHAPYSWYIMLAATLITVFSGIAYFWNEKELLKEIF